MYSVNVCVCVCVCDVLGQRSFEDNLDGNVII